MAGRLPPTITVGSICASMVMSVIEVEGLAVRVPARQTTLSIAHEVSPCLGTLHDRNAQPMGDDFRIVTGAMAVRNDERRTSTFSGLCS